MGCILPKDDKEPEQSEATKQNVEEKLYSFDIKKAKLRKEDFMFKDRDGELLVRDPGQINGQQFIIDSCKNCKIFLRDFTPAINMYSCEDCEVFLGPCSGSIYIRNSKNCKVIVATAQLRIYNCENFDLLVFSISDPSIEQCTNLRIGCFDYCYTELKEQFGKAKLNIWNNVWSEVYDFTPRAGNYSYLLPHKSAKELLNVTHGFDDSCTPVVPLTVGKSKDTFSHVKLFIKANRKEC